MDLVSGGEPRGGAVALQTGSYAVLQPNGREENQPEAGADPCLNPL